MTGTCGACGRPERIVGPYTCSKTGAHWPQICNICKIKIAYADHGPRVRAAREVSEAIRGASVVQPQPRMIM